ncbi:MAG TPA: hypothetical protein VGD56_16030 [Gemmatirosa sp.]
MIRSIPYVLSALLIPAFVAGAQTTAPAQTTGPAQTTAPAKPTHHSLIKGAAAGAVAGHYGGKAATGHGHAVLGAVAGMEAQHLRNKREKRAYQQQLRGQPAVAPTTTP